MGRVSENKAFINNIPKKENLSACEADIELKSIIAGALIDISKSLAVLADYWGDKKHE